MGLLAPLFLLGVLAVALPFWLHRLQTQSSERKSFSSTMLMETASEQVHVRRKLKYLLLLALRIALLALLAFAFAKPFLTMPPDAVVATDEGSRIILVDTSASMGRAGVFSQARVEAKRAIDDAPADALLQLVEIDSALHLLGELTIDKSSLRAGVDSLSVTALHADYGETMIAIDRLAATLPKPVQIHFVSDYQTSAMPVRFSDLVPASATKFVPHVVGTGAPFNWSIGYVRETSEGIDVGFNGVGDHERVADIDVILNGSVHATQSLSQAGTLSVHFDVPEYEAGENRVEIRLSADDDLQGDNHWYHVVDNDPPAAIPVITLNAGGLPLTYLSAALESTGNYTVLPLIAGELDTRVLSRYSWLIIDDIGLVDAQLELALTDYLQGGGNILAFAGERASALESLPLTAHRHTANSVRTSTDEFLSMGQIDLRHPALAQTEGWQSVNVTRSLPIEEQGGDDVLIRLENNEAFLLERSMSVGRIMLLMGNLDNRWNDLPIRPVFVSFMIEVARYLSGINEISKTYTAGTTLPLSLTGNTSGQVVDPDGNTILSLADTTREQQIQLRQIGFYEVFTPQGQTVVAANVDPLESDLRSLSQDVLERWQDSVRGQVVVDNISFSTDDTRAVELWHWLLLLLAITVIGESIVGNSYLSPRRS